MDEVTKKKLTILPIKDLSMERQNYVIYSKKNKGLTTGSLGLYALEGDAEKTIFGAKENTSGNLLYGMKDEKLKLQQLTQQQMLKKMDLLFSLKYH